MSTGLNLDNLKKEINSRKSTREEAIQETGKSRYTVLESLKVGRPNQVTEHLRNIAAEADIKAGGTTKISKKNDGLTDSLMEHVGGGNKPQPRPNTTNNDLRNMQDPNIINERVEMDSERDNTLYAEIERKQKEYQQNYGIKPNPVDYGRQQVYPQNQQQYSGPANAAGPVNPNELFKHVENLSMNFLNEKMSEFAYEALKNDIIETYRIDLIKKTIMKHPEVFKDIIINIIKDLSK